mmetsp:Transcript_41306/g.117044  ORF Transcript_41306/g.117044 Transcript_41306/m.117044 type:complete len:369 (+) Transcript_41306:220-1326(+)
MLRISAPTAGPEPKFVGAEAWAMRAAAPRQKKKATIWSNGGAKTSSKSSRGNSTSRFCPDAPSIKKHSHLPTAPGAETFSKRCRQQSKASEAVEARLVPSSSLCSRSSSPRKTRTRPRSRASKTRKGEPRSAPRAAGREGGLDPPAGRPKKASRRGSWSSTSKSTALAAGARKACTSAFSRRFASSGESVSPVLASQTSKAFVTAPSVASSHPLRMRTRRRRKVSESTGRSSGWSGTRLSSTTVFGPKFWITTTPLTPSANRLRYTEGNEKPSSADCPPGNHAGVGRDAGAGASDRRSSMARAAKAEVAAESVMTSEEAPAELLLPLLPPLLRSKEPSATSVPWASSPSRTAEAVSDSEAASINSWNC